MQLCITDFCFEWKFITTYMGTYMRKLEIFMVKLGKFMKIYVKSHVSSEHHPNMRNHGSRKIFQWPWIWKNSLGLKYQQRKTSDKFSLKPNYIHRFTNHELHLIHIYIHIAITFVQVLRAFRSSIAGTHTARISFFLWTLRRIGRLYTTSDCMDAHFIL